MFGFDLMETTFLFSIAISFFAGFLSFISPCVLPIVPPYLAYMAGTTVNEVKTEPNVSYTTKLTLVSISFVLGLSTVFMLLGLAASAMGSFFLPYQHIMGYIAGSIVTVFGLHFLGVFNISILNRDFRFNLASNGGSLTGAYFLGIAFAFGWTPCIGPVLGGILSMAAQESSLQKGVILMLFYATGLGIPFVLCGIFFSKSLFLMNIIKRNMTWVQRLMGTLLIFVGLLLFTGGFSSLSFWLLESLPFLATFG
jgi:cytochrome c-type biogenesis protein